MPRKFTLIFGVICSAGLMLARQSFAQAGSFPVSTSQTYNPVPAAGKSAADGTMAPQKAPAAAAPSLLPGWEKRYLEIASQTDAPQSESLRELAATIREDQIHDALYVLAMDQSDPARMLVVFLGQRWAQNSPAEAAQWAAVHMTDDIFGNNLFSGIMVSWADKDLAGATAWVQKMPADGNKTAAAASLATEAAALKQAPTAINVATNIPPGQQRDDVLNYSAQQWAITDRDGAVAWIKQVPDAALRAKMLGEVAVNLGAQDPAAGTKFAATMPEGEDRDNAMGTVIRFWGASAPADAAAWVEQCPDGPLRDLAMESLMDTWGRKNLAEASQWLNKLPAGHSRDVAANALAHMAK